jgi:predicted Zn-dependent protease
MSANQPLLLELRTMDFIRIRSRLLPLALLIMIVVAGCGGGGGSNPNNNLPGYVSSCLVDGNVVRWTHMPIDVYFDTTTVPSNWTSADQDRFIDAMNEWTVASGSQITFRTITTQHTPCISVKWVQDSPMGHTEAAGVARFQTVSGTNYFDVVYIEIGTSHYQSGIPYTNSQMKTISLHELGHAIGLWGHSDDPGDIMYGEGGIAVTSISTRDASTLAGLYLLDADISDAPSGLTVTSRNREGFEIP